MESLDKSQFAVVDEKGFVPDDSRNSFFRKLRMQSCNRSCFECPNRNPTWISLTYGIYLCLECSGEHRRKGVHISFVRSVELDRFTPEQMIQMAVGGNGKALEFFKSNEMGKTSGSARPVDYNSKAVLRYKQMMEAESRKLCAQMEVATKSAALASAALAAVAPVVADPVDEAADFSFAPATPKAAAGPYPSVPPAAQALARGYSAPAATSGAKHATTPASVVVRRMEPAAPSTEGATQQAAGPIISKHAAKAKEIDFDFNFDDIEKEASKPKPVAAPKPAAAPAPKPVVAAPPQAEALSRAKSEPAATVNKFANKKGISSEDFFHDLESETASARMEREQRSQKFANAGAISSDSYFGSEDPSADLTNDNVDDWSAMASMAAQEGSKMARTSISKGAELISEYLAKVRD